MVLFNSFDCCEAGGSTLGTVARLQGGSEVVVVYTHVLDGPKLLSEPVAMGNQNFELQVTVAGDCSGLFKFGPEAIAKKKC